ncbi:MAG: hypothetical protein PWP23_2490 [Candidatus Sumerlaeota bacterium]|nr:hypothetical protein [Candidatus Sumerlaeota bacterium]
MHKVLTTCGLTLGMFAASAVFAVPTYIPGSLKAHYKLDQTSGTTVIDSSGNANNGTLQELTTQFPVVNGPVMNANGPTPSASTQRNAVELDGSNDVLYVSSETSLEFDKTRGSISLWMNADANARMSILRCVNGGSYNGPSLEKTSSSIASRVYFYPNLNEGYFMAEHAPVPGAWEHYVFTWDYTEADSGDAANPNRVKCYVNGVQTTNRTASGGTGDTTFTTKPSDAVGDWVFGQRFLDSSSTQRPFDGEFAEIAIYDTDLSGAEALSLYENGVNTAHANLVAFWDFSEGSGTTVGDDAGIADMFTSETTPTFPEGAGPTWVTANAGANKPAYITKALEFDGTDDCFTIPDSASLDFDKAQGTITGWFYFPAAGSGRRGLIGSQNSGFQSESHSSDSIYFYPTGSGLLVLGGTRTYDDWMHVAFVWDNTAATKAELFFNGVSVASTTTAFSATTTNDWTVGRKAELTDTTNPRWFLGQMADIAIFDHPYLVEDINYIIANGVAVFQALPVELDVFTID